MVSRYGGHVINDSATIAEVENSGTPGAGRADQGQPGRDRQVADRRVCLLRHLDQPMAPGVIQTTVHPANSYRRPGGRFPSFGRGGQVTDIVDGVLLLEWLL